MEVNEVVKLIKNTKKYKNIDPEVINDIVISLSYKYSGSQLLEKVKSKLHQIWGAYYTTRPNFNKLLKKYFVGEITTDQILLIHQSTKERMGEYDEIFDFIFNKTKHESILDVGCGFNPLYMAKRTDFNKYVGVDIDIEQQDFLSKILVDNNKIEIKVGSFADSINDADLTLALKLLPVLDQIEPGNSRKFLSSLNNTFLAISFPNRSISGKDKGMLENYRTIYLPIIHSLGFILKNEKSFKNETVYIFKK